MEVGPDSQQAGVARRFAAGIVAVTGKNIAWLLLILVLITFSVVVLRYGMNLGWIWLQELIVYLHSAVFLLAIAWAFQADEHVRVDIFYRSKSSRHKAWINLLGTVLFVIPFSVFLFLMGWDYVMASWSVLEGSREAGGLDFVYILKTLILMLPLLLLIQTCDTIPRCISIIRNNTGSVTS